MALKVLFISEGNTGCINSVFSFGIEKKTNNNRMARLPQVSICWIQSAPLVPFEFSQVENNTSPTPTILTANGEKEYPKIAVKYSAKPMA